MRPFTITEAAQAKKAMKVGPVNARQQLLMDKAQQALDLIGTEAGVPDMVEKCVVDGRGKDIKDKTYLVTKFTPDTPEMGHEAGQVVYKDVEMSERELVLYQVASTLLLLLKESWTYR